MALAMDFAFLLDPRPPAALDRLSAWPRDRSTRAATICSPPRRGWPAFSRSPRATFRHATGSGSAALSRRSERRGADLLVGIDVRVPDAVAGDARAGRQPARADQPADRAPADRVRADARRSVGHLGVRLQRPRPGVHLPVFELRRSRPRPEARPRRNTVIAPYATALAAMVDPQAAARNFARLDRHRRARPLRLLRGAGLHAEPRARGQDGRDRARLHGASPGHDDRRDRQRAARRQHAGALPRRADDPGDRAAAAGAHAARCRGRRIRGQRRSRSATTGRQHRSRPAAGDFTTAARRHAGNASALQRPLRGDAHRGRLGLQPLARLR